MNSCHACTLPLAPTDAACPHCGEPRREFDIAPILALDRKPRRFHPALHATMLALALPVIAPSLISTWLMAKRWGRVPYVWILIDGFILVFLSLRAPWLSGFFGLSLLSAMALSIVRHQRLESGIFLGYSNAVAMLIIVGGFISIVGIFLSAPWRWGAETPEPVAVTADRIDDVRPGQRVRLAGAVLDPDQMLWLYASGQFDATPPDPGVTAAEQWVPVRDRARVWVIFDGAAAIQGPIEGTLEADPPGLADALERADGRAPSSLRAVRITPPPDVDRGDLLAALKWLVPGLLLTILAVVLAIREN